MSFLKAVISGKDSSEPKHIRVKLSIKPLSSSIIILQSEVNSYLSQLVKNSDEGGNDSCEDEESEEEELKETCSTNKRAGEDLRLNKKIKQ